MFRPNCGSHRALTPADFERFLCEQRAKEKTVAVLVAKVSGFILGFGRTHLEIFTTQGLHSCSSEIIRGFVDEQGRFYQGNVFGGPLPPLTKFFRIENGKVLWNTAVYLNGLRG